MHALTTLLTAAALAPATFAWGPETVTVCRREDINRFSCTASLTNAQCADKVLAIEQEVSGDWKSEEFLEGWCSIPSERWSRLERAIDETCGDQIRDVLNAYTAVCYNWRSKQKPYVCDKANQRTHTEKELVFYVCGSDVTTYTPPAATKPATSSTQAPKSSAPVGSNSTMPIQTPPIVVSGGSVAAGINMAAVALGVAAIL
ncbi:hypothetical protein VHEMI02027 [[Torrubiella] hemipterigena]|uniref:Uncharacterized protein n=1 Tax=[Torrubiella] hemipterigena TaxID=1531966 RepID=A0A0A1SNG8_9HYPO|nr:hypothetical protein VHEMI02027 [[Torrubiella] hemipterigena]